MCKNSGLGDAALRFWATRRPAQRPGGRQDAPSHGGWKDANIVRWWSNVVRTRTSTRKGTLNCDIESGVFHLSVCLYDPLRVEAHCEAGWTRLTVSNHSNQGGKIRTPFIGAPACAVLMLNRLAENQSRSHNNTSTATNHNCLGLVMWQVLNVANCWNYTPWKEKLPTMATRVNWELLCPSKEATGFFQVSSKAAVLFTSLETAHHYSPENNMSPETSWLEDYFLYWNGPFLGNIRSFRPHLATFWLPTTPFPCLTKDFLRLNVVVVHPCQGAQVLISTQEKLTHLTPTVEILRQGCTKFLDPVWWTSTTQNNQSLVIRIFIQREIQLPISKNVTVTHFLRIF